MVKFTVDQLNRQFVVKPGITDINVQVDLFSDAKEEWLAVPVLRKNRFPIRPVGGDETSGGQNAPRYYFLRERWRILVDGESIIASRNLYVDVADGGGSAFIILNGGTVENQTSDAGGVGEAIETLTASLDIINANTLLARQHARNKTICNAEKTHFDIYDDDDTTIIDTIDITNGGLTRN